MGRVNSERRETINITLAIIQVKDSGLDQGGSSRDDKKRAVSRYV